MKSYSVAILNKAGVWLTNWNEYNQLDDIDFSKVEALCLEHGYKGYGYYYGHHSGGLTSNRCRTVLKILDQSCKVQQ
jgi:hypothetical protein